MNTMKECFSGHAVMHGLFGLGLGVLLTTLITSLQNIWIGIVLMVIAVLFDMMRKKPASKPPVSPTM